MSDQDPNSLADHFEPVIELMSTADKELNAMSPTTVRVRDYLTNERAWAWSITEEWTGPLSVIFPNERKS